MTDQPVQIDVMRLLFAVTVLAGPFEFPKDELYDVIWSTNPGELIMFEDQAKNTIRIGIKRDNNTD